MMHFFFVIRPRRCRSRYISLGILEELNLTLSCLPYLRYLAVWQTARLYYLGNKHAAEVMRAESST